MSRIRCWLAIAVIAAALVPHPAEAHAARRLAHVARTIRACEPSAPCAPGRGAPAHSRKAAVPRTLRTSRGGGAGWERHRMPAVASVSAVLAAARTGSLDEHAATSRADRLRNMGSNRGPPRQRASSRFVVASREIRVSSPNPLRACGPRPRSRRFALFSCLPPSRFLIAIASSEIDHQSTFEEFTPERLHGRSPADRMEGAAA